MKSKSTICMFKKIDVGKSEILRAFGKSRVIWAVVTRIGKRKWCVYGIENTKKEPR